MGPYRSDDPVYDRYRHDNRILIKALAPSIILHGRVR
jgi:hypothetical protein